MKVFKLKGEDGPSKVFFASSTSFKSYLFVAALVLVLAFLFYTRFIVERLRDEDRRALQVCANLYALAATETTTGAELNLIFDEVIKKTDFPIIVTDKQGVPQAWKGVGIAVDNRSEKALARLSEIVEKMDSSLQPIPLRIEEGGQVFGYLHYGDSGVVKHMSWMPYVEIGVVGLFVFIGFLGYRNIKRSEQRHVWVGMAKETAHQLGTPISSLMGWLELVRRELKKVGKEAGREDGRRLEGIIDKMGGDVDRLSEIASRFGQIGSIPKLKEEDLTSIISETVNYFRNRLPQLSKPIEIYEHYGEIPPVYINRVLMQWVLENLFKNAIDAIGSDGGWIEVSTQLDSDQRGVFISFKDSGRGVSQQEQRDIFLAGYTTKLRGWGLGLTLAKRIVEEYHGGKVFLKESKPNQGSTFMMKLPVKRS